MADLGDRLYRTVVEYCDLGDHHRSGTPEDEATVAWFAAAVERLGGSVQILPYEFDRYEAEWELALDGEPVVSIPLFYEGVGDVHTDRVATAAVPVPRGSNVPAFEPVARRALDDGVPAAVIATATQTGLLMAVNRYVKMGSGLPALCVAGALAERLANARIDLSLRARVVTGRSANVLATFGEADFGDRILLTTPLSGWFKCAAERGGGIAVCLEVARQLAGRAPIAVLGSNGHELMGHGVRRYLAEDPPRPAGVFHFGANFAGAVEDPATGTLRPPPSIGVNGWLRPGDRDAFAAAFAHLGTPIGVFEGERPPPPEQWVGESRAWSELGLPLISMAGGQGNRLHHAPEDVPERATTPAILADVCRAALDASPLLIPPDRRDR